MTRPRIGLTVDYVTGKPHYMLPFTYAQAVRQAGGLPWMIPFHHSNEDVGDYLDHLDGLILSGGDDLDPSVWGEPYHPNAKPIDPARQSWDMQLLSQAEQKRMPVFGICLGMQMINVYRGGSLIQFLPDRETPCKIEHRLMGDWSRRHSVQVFSNTQLREILGEPEVSVNTSHKQAVRELGRGLIQTALSPDGLIEGIEDPTFPCFFGVQWHPERQYDEPTQLKLFQHLVRHAREYAQQRDQIKDPV
ncbi:MAG: gamma-glutamyl-gamma-aminobutyrate hydrolase [Phycisphaerae bacterium]|nr:MAG: gamma-glutamyl-gamma-aminobutyrate hydrolase [Phycisphaerae bacterium]